MSIVAASAPNRVPAVVAACLAGIGLAVATFPPAGLSAVDARAAALVIATIGLWATGVIAESLTALIFFTVAMLAGIAPAGVVFSGLVSSAFWLVLSGLVIGAALTRSGLGARIAARLAALLDSTYRGAMVGVVLFGLAMSFLMPSSMGRVVLMLPILTALAEHLGHAKASRGHHGLVLGGVFGTVLPSFSILPANIPNNVLAGLVETTFGRPLAFGDYLLVHFPVLGLAKTLLLIAVLLVLYRGETHPRPPGESEGGLPTPMSGAEWRLTVVLAIALALWATDSLHHISPAWVGMAAAVACLAPPLGLLPPRGLQRVNLEPVFYVGGIVSLGALVTHAGLGQRLAEWAVHVMALAPGATASDFAQLCGLSAAVGLLTTLPGVPAVMTPLTGGFAAASGLPAATVVITQVVGFSTVLLPYQAPPLVMALQTADLPRGEMTRLCLTTAAVTVIVLWPLDLLWLSWLGRLAN